MILDELVQFLQELFIQIADLAGHRIFLFFGSFLGCLLFIGGSLEL